MSSEAPITWARPAHRLRDLDRRGRVGAVVLLVVALVPPALALIRALHDGWIPSGDEANIATRALDVFSRHPPLTGLLTTSAQYGTGIQTNHPGPIEFYLLAVPLRVLGMTAGPLLTALTINTGAVLIALWVVFRRLGYAAMLWAGVLALAFMWSTGTVVLTDTLSSNMTTYSLLATAVLAWAVIDGDARVLPLAAFVASYAAQQHLAAGIIVGALGAFMLVALAAISFARRRRGDPPTGLPWRGCTLIALGILALCWLPVLDDEVSGHPGNLTAIIRFARDGKRPTVGLKAGFFQALHAIGPPGILGRSVSSGLTFIASPGAAATLLALVVVGLLAVVTAFERRRNPSLARLALVALVVIAAGMVNGGNVPLSSEDTRVNLYRWTWTAGFLTWLAIGVAAASVAARLIARRGDAPRPAWRPTEAVALLAATALIAAAIGFVPDHSSHNREQPDFRAEKIVNAAALDHLDTNRPVRVLMYGSTATLSIGPALIFRLVQSGHRIEVASLSEPVYGTSRAYRPRSNPVTIVVQSGKAEEPSGPGALLAWQPLGASVDARFRALAARRTALMQSLAQEAAGQPVALSTTGAHTLDTQANNLNTWAFKVLLNELPTQPLSALRSSQVLTFALYAGLRTPVLDGAKLRALLAMPAWGPNVNGDEQVQVHLVDSTATGT